MPLSTAFFIVVNEAYTDSFVAHSDLSAALIVGRPVDQELIETESGKK